MTTIEICENQVCLNKSMVVFCRKKLLNYCPAVAFYLELVEQKDVQ